MLALLLATALAGGNHSLDYSYVRELMPHQGWPALHGEVEGLLVEGGDHAWGTPVGWTGFLDRPNYCAYRFSMDGHAPWAVYFEDPTGVGYNQLKGWTAGSAWATGVDASMLCSRTGAAYGLDGPVHVVRAEVNHGEPVRANLHFVITAAERLDGTKAVPMDPHAALIAARKAFDEGLAQRRSAIRALLAKGEDAGTRASEHVPAQSFDADPITRVFPTWDAEQQALIAVFVWTDDAGRQHTSTETQYARCPPGAPCTPPREQQVTQSWIWGVEAAAVYTLAADGAIASVQWHEPRATRNF